MNGFLVDWWVECIPKICLERMLFPKDGAAANMCSGSMGFITITIQIDRETPRFFRNDTTIYSQLRLLETYSGNIAWILKHMGLEEGISCKT